MVTKYDAVAEIEAFKAARLRKRDARRQPSHRAEYIPATPKPVESADAVNEDDIRAEMERRLARRGLQRAS